MCAAPEQLSTFRLDSGCFNSNSTTLAEDTPTEPRHSNNQLATHRDLSIPTPLASPSEYTVQHAQQADFASGNRSQRKSGSQQEPVIPKVIKKLNHCLPREELVAIAQKSVLYSKRQL